MSHNHTHTKTQKESSSLWQSANWAKMLSMSRQVEKIIPLENFGIHIEKRRLSLSEYGLFVIGYTGKISEKFEIALNKVCRQENALFIQIESIDYTNSPLIFEKHHSQFYRGYYKKFIPPYTALIDLTPEKDVIFSQLKSKVRYKIGLLEKKDAYIKKVEKTDENIQLFFKMMKQTTTRNKFSGNSLSYYQTFLQTLPNSELFLAYQGESVIAGGIFVFEEKGVAYYYYGASADEGRNLMAPYALQWAAISEAKDRGCILYDFLGVATPGDMHSSLSGVTYFKSQFTQDFRQVSESFIWVHKKWKYKLMQFLRKLKS